MIDCTQPTAGYLALPSVATPHTLRCGAYSAATRREGVRSAGSFGAVDAV